MYRGNGKHCRTWVSTTSNVTVSEDFFPFIITARNDNSISNLGRYNGKDIMYEI
jgi:hypothetical protein